VAEEMGIVKVLWLAPNLNHYKARFLNRLQRSGRISLFLLSGILSKYEGYAAFNDNLDAPLKTVNVPKKKWGWSWQVLKAIFDWHKGEKFAWIMIPAESKFFPSLFIISMLKGIKKYQVFSYNHSVVGEHWYHRLISKLMYALLDRVVFYTENEREVALDLKLLPQNKAFFANNALDEDEVAKHYKFEIKSLKDPAILFIGRLIPNKRIELLLNYFQELRKKNPDLRLLIIGDGPEAHLVKKHMETDSNIEWFGALSDEAEIAPVMKRANVVINPGASGLSVNHAFMYGKPYVACENSKHGPEVWYLVDDDNGLMLSGVDVTSDCSRIIALLEDDSKYKAMCFSARDTALKYNVTNWVKQMEGALEK
jgi:glycosyltransferase involved in cell wall biosynthesis